MRRRVLDVAAARLPNPRLPCDQHPRHHAGGWRDGWRPASSFPNQEGARPSPSSAIGSGKRSKRPGSSRSEARSDRGRRHTQRSSGSSPRPSTRATRCLGCPLNNLALELSLADPEFQHAVQSVFERLADGDREKAARRPGCRRPAKCPTRRTSRPSSSRLTPGPWRWRKPNRARSRFATCARQLAALVQSRWG